MTRRMLHPRCADVSRSLQWCQGGRRVRRRVRRSRRASSCPHPGSARLHLAALGAKGLPPVIEHGRPRPWRTFRPDAVPREPAPNPHGRMGDLAQDGGVDAGAAPSHRVPAAEPGWTPRRPGRPGPRRRQASRDAGPGPQRCASAASAADQHVEAGLGGVHQVRMGDRTELRADEDGDASLRAVPPVLVTVPAFNIPAFNIAVLGADELARLRLQSGERGAVAVGGLLDGGGMFDRAM